jgi:hypothetical protein
MIKDVKGKEILISAIPQLTLEGFVLSERSQAQKDKHHVIEC